MGLIRDAANGLIAGLTAAQFANDQDFATNEFVQRALGNKSKFYNYTANTTLTAAHTGGEIWVSAAGLTLTLPLAATCPAGTMLYFYGNSAGMTLVRQGSDSILNGELGGGGALTVPAQGRVGLCSNGGSAWYTVDGATALGGSTEFKSVRSAVGYQKLPSGLILQWGASNPSSGVANITFPTAFSARPYYVGFGYREANDPTSIQSIVINDPTLTATAMTVRTFYTYGSGMYPCASAFFWYAIGA